MAAPPSFSFAAFVNEDDGSVADFAFLSSATTLGNIEGVGPKALAEAVKVALDNKWNVTSLGGLDVLRRAAKDVPEEFERFKRLALDHVDAAYDFLVDNGYPLTWDSIIPETPETAVQAAKMTYEFIRNAETSGTVKRKTMAGRDAFWALTTFEVTPSGSGSLRFRTVAEALSALEACPPDQSWMTSGVVDVAAETNWLG